MMTQRTINEQEARAVSVVLHNTIIAARQTLARWVLRKNKPTKEEMMFIASTLFSVEKAIEEMIEGPPSDGHSLDSSYDMIVDMRKELNDELSDA